MRTIHILYFSLLSIGILNTGCDEGEKQEATILGTWEAEWQNNSAESKRENDIMQGKMTFKEDHHAEVEVYGYKDCVFFSDTVRQELQWQLIGGDTLQLLNPSSSFNISYAIKDLPEASLQLKFMEDITIKLTRL